MTWGLFAAPDGNINCFLNHSETTTDSGQLLARSLLDIRNSCDRIKEFERDLLELKKSCTLSLKDVSSSPFCFGGNSLLESRLTFQ
jgi:hypothetical protein